MENFKENEDDNVKVSSDTNDEDKFPEGMRVLVVDDDNACLKILQNLLDRCGYQVSVTTEPDEALELLKKNKNDFDIVITDVHMKDKCDGFKLLEIIGLEMDLPVIMMSGDADKRLVLKAVKHGACDYLLKPVRSEEIQNIWQHVVRKTSFDSGDVNVRRDLKNGMLRSVKRGRENVKEDVSQVTDTTAPKKPRFNWTRENHARFISVINELGLDKAVPSKIVEKMCIPGLTRDHVASHLQKFRNGLKKSRSQQSNSTTSAGIDESLSSPAALSFNSQRRSMEPNFQSFKINGGIQFGHPVQKPETIACSYLNPKLPSPFVNRQTLYPRPFPQPLQPPPHTNHRIFGGIPSNSITAENQLHNTGLQHHAFPPRIIPSSNKYTELSSNVHTYAARNVYISNNSSMFGFPNDVSPLGDSSKFSNSLCNELGLPTEMSLIAKTDSENMIPDQFESNAMEIQNFDDEYFILSDYNVMDEGGVDYLEIDSTFPGSTSSSMDDELKAVVKQVQG